MGGRKVFQPATVLTAADVNEFLMDQSVMSFAGTAARGSAIGTATEGMVTYLQDSNSLEFWNGAQWQNVNDNTASVPLNTVTAAGDLIVANGSASVTRLPIGTAQSIPYSTGTALAYLNPGTAQQVLTIGSAGAIEWAAPQTGGVAYYYRNGGGGGTASVSIGTGIYAVTYTGSGSATINGTNYAQGVTYGEFTTAATAVVFPVGFGSVWTTASFSSDNGSGQLAFSNDVWIGTAFGGTVVWRSTDGLNWTSNTVPEAVTAALAGNNTYVVGGSNVIYSSTNGTTWTTRTSPVNKTWRHGNYLNGYFILCSSDGTSLAYATDGVTWTSRTLVSADSGHGIEYDGSKWWAGRGVSGTWRFYSSTDLVTWTTSNIGTGFSSGVYGSAYWPNGTNKYFVFNSSTLDSYRYSTDGVTWSTGTWPGSTEGWDGLAVGNSLYATDNNTARVLVTTNGTSWTTAQTASGQTRGIAASSYGIIAGHTGGVQSRSLASNQFLAIEQKTGFTSV